MTEADHIDLHTLVQSLSQHRKFIFCVSVLTCLFAISYTVFKPITYQASVLLQIHHNQASSLGSLSQPKDYGVAEPIPVQIALIRSKFILGPVIQTLKLNKLPESQMMNRIRSHLTITDLAGSGDNVGDKPGILQLTLTGENSHDVIQLVNHIALMTQLKDRERKSLDAKKTLAFLYQQLPLIQSALKEAETKLSLYRTNSGKMDVKLQTHYLFNHLSDIEKQLEAARLKKIELSQQYTAYHPAIIALNDTYQALVKQRDDLLAEIKTLTTTDQTATNLERDVNVQKNQYMLLLSKIHEQEVITAGVVSDISVLSFATSPDMLQSVKLSIIVLASLIIGFLVGCSAVLMRQLIKPSRARQQAYPITLADARGSVR